MICRRKDRNVENMKAADIVLSQEDIAELNDVLKKHPVAGHRYFGETVDVRLWG